MTKVTIVKSAKRNGLSNPGDSITAKYVPQAKPNWVTFIRYKLLASFQKVFHYPIKKVDTSKYSLRSSHSGTGPAFLVV